MSDDMVELEKILNVPFTFSVNCRSGLLTRCECWRCRKGRGEEMTEETEKLAAEQAKIADNVKLNFSRDFPQMLVAPPIHRWEDEERSNWDVDAMRAEFRARLYKDAPIN